MLSRVLTWREIIRIDSKIVLLISICHGNIDPSHCSCRSWTHRFHSHPLLHDESRPQTGKVIKRSIFGFAVNQNFAVSSNIEIKTNLKKFRFMLIQLIEKIKLSETSRNTQNSNRHIVFIICTKLWALFEFVSCEVVCFFVALHVQVRFVFLSEALK